MNSEKDAINSWLNKSLDGDLLVIDHVLDIFDEILKTFNKERWYLRQDENTLLMNLIYYLYYNSYTDII